MSVVCDLDGKCLKGSTDYDGQVLHIGNGIARFSRQDMFGPNPNARYVELEWNQSSLQILRKREYVPCITIY